jgi:CubicO group peptidase (beta-lactamase class C family)
MIPTRRAVLAGAGAAVFVGCANAQGLRSRNKPPSVDGPYGPAAEYSAARRGVSLLVMQGGRVLLETYARPGGATRGRELASGTKSCTGVMAALASADGLLNIDEPAVKALVAWRDDKRNTITIRHLLNLTAGLKGEGDVARPPN